MRGTRKSYSLPLCARAAVTKRDVVGLHLQPLPEDRGCRCYEVEQGLKRFACAPKGREQESKELKSQFLGGMWQQWEADPHPMAALT